MAFAGHCGLDIALPAARGTALAQLFCEEPGRRGADHGRRRAAAAADPCAPWTRRCRACTSARRSATCACRCASAPSTSMSPGSTSGAPGPRPPGDMRRLRDDPQCADEEFAAMTATADAGLAVAAELRSGGRCRRAVHCARRAAGGRDPARAGRQQPDRDGRGVRPRWVHAARCAHDRPALRAPLAREFKGLVACGGFSYGDVLGAGEGWAKSILFHEGVRAEFQRSSRARIPSRSASATAARCSRR